MIDVDNFVSAKSSEAEASQCEGNAGGIGTIDYRNPKVFHLMMRATIEKVKHVHFYRFEEPVSGSNYSTCDMAWLFRPKKLNIVGLYKDYRRFVIERSENCTLNVVSIGEYHSGVNAKSKKNQKTEIEKNVNLFPVIGEIVNDSLPVVESEGSFVHGKYLIYVGGGDRCKSMNHYLWSFLCALGEAQYLNRTLVMDLSICLSSIYTSSKKDEERKDFRFYFDFEHLKEAASVLDKEQFWEYWNKYQQKHGMSLHLVEDYGVTPMKLKEVKDALIMRKFGSFEPDNYWHRVCEGETESVVERPWNLIWKSRRLMDIVSAIASRLNWDYDSVYFVRGEKARNEALLLSNSIGEGRNLYIATNETDTSFFDPLKEKFTTHFLDEFKDLWDETSEWYSETTKLNNGKPVEFDGYMRGTIDTVVHQGGKRHPEIINGFMHELQ